CKPAKSYYDAEAEIVSWILEPFDDADTKRFQSVLRREGAHAKSLHRSFDSSVMDVADDIAYGVHDLEDAIAIGLVSRD
ncbi:hypothetical protein ACETUS_31825, partial [Priestia megaterium]